MSLRIQSNCFVCADMVDTIAGYDERFAVMHARSRPVCNKILLLRRAGCELDADLMCMLMFTRYIHNLSVDVVQLLSIN